MTCDLIGEIMQSSTIFLQIIYSKCIISTWLIAYANIEISTVSPILVPFSR